VAAGAAFISGESPAGIDEDEEFPYLRVVFGLAFAWVLPDQRPEVSASRAHLF
jgi:hypothetical protein